MAKVDQKFIVQLQGKDFVTYEGLLDLAHQKGLRAISVDLIQVPTKENDMTVICKATVKTENDVYVDIGDANPKSVNSNISPHMIRMASTRAKARALRDLTNIGITAYEELADGDVQNKDDEDKQAIINNSMAMDNQLKTLYVLAKEKGFTKTMPGYIKNTYGKQSSKELTKQEASEIIKMLQDLGE